MPAAPVSRKEDLPTAAARLSRSKTTSVHGASASFIRVSNFSRSAAVGMGITVLARALVVPPLRIVKRGQRLPQLPTIELVYSQGRRNNSQVVSELADLRTV